jgi:hypothetical protein
MTILLTKALPQESPQVAKATPQRKRVLIDGSGFAGIAAERAVCTEDAIRVDDVMESPKLAE